MDTKAGKATAKAPLGKNAKIVAIAALVLVLAALFVGRDLYLRSQRTVTCAEGSHPAIDMREFTTQYWAYSGKLEVTVDGKAKIVTEVDPKLLAQVSASIQEANEFRKYVVAGYNACAITPTQYAQLEPRFKTLENLAQRIDSVLSRDTRSPEEKAALLSLMTQYVEVARQLNPH